MNLNQIINSVLWYPMEQATLFVGNQGIGKSQAIKLAAKVLDIPLLDFRCSQIDVGDLKGMPFYVDGHTFFAPPDNWPITEEDSLKLLKALGLKNFNRGCGDWGILLLDEVNRATREVQQAIFELILDRRLNFRGLPKYWRVVACINGNDDAYSVNSLDPAFLSRFFMAKAEPTFEEWLDYAKGNHLKVEYDKEAIHKSHEEWETKKKDLTIHPAVIEFMIKQPSFLDPTDELIKESATKLSKIFDRRAWEMFSNWIHKAEMDFAAERTKFNPLAKDPQSLNELFMACLGFVGAMAAGKFRSFIETDYQALDAKRILEHWDDAVEAQIKKVVGLGRCTELGAYNELLIEYIKQHVKDNKLSKTQGDNFVKYIECIPKELRTDIWVTFNKECHDVSTDWFGRYPKGKMLFSDAFRKPNAKKDAATV